MTGPVGDKGTFLRREYTRLLDGDILASLMLCQLVYWCMPNDGGKPKLRVNKGGTWWVSKSHKDRQEELGLSRIQSRRCLELLELRGLIVKHLFCFNGAPTMHVRLTVAGGERMLSHVPSVTELAPQQASDSIGGQQPKVQEHWLPGAKTLAISSQSFGCQQPNITEITTETTTENKTCEQNSFAKCPAKPTATGEQSKTGMETDMKAADVVANYKNKPAGSLEAHWKDRMSLLFGKTIATNALTQQERGQLKQLVKAMNEGHADTPSVEHTKQVLDFVLNHWLEFGAEAQFLAGLTQYPPEPHIGFLLKYQHIAAQMSYDDQQKQLMTTG
jgi:hypothetical protein